MNGSSELDRTDGQDFSGAGGGSSARICMHVGFEDLRIDCIVGVYSEERERTQPVYIDLSVTYDASDAVTVDEVKFLDYTLLADSLYRQVTERNFGLIETLAYVCAHELLREFPQIIEVDMTVKKPQGLPGSRNSFVRYTLSR